MCGGMAPSVPGIGGGFDRRMHDGAERKFVPPIREKVHAAANPSGEDGLGHGKDRNRRSVNLHSVMKSGRSSVFTDSATPEDGARTP